MLDKRMKKVVTFFLSSAMVFSFSICSLAASYSDEEINTMDLTRMRGGEDASYPESIYREVWSTYEVLDSAQKITYIESGKYKKKKQSSGNNDSKDSVVSVQKYINANSLVVASKYFANDNTELLGKVTNSGFWQNLLDGGNLGELNASARVAAMVYNNRDEFERMAEIYLDFQETGGEITEELIQKYRYKTAYTENYLVCYEKGRHENIKISDIIEEYDIRGGDVDSDEIMDDLADKAGEEREEKLAQISEELEPMIGELDITSLHLIRNKDPMDYVDTAGIYQVAQIETLEKQATSWYQLMKTIGFIGMVISVSVGALRIAINPRSKSDVLGSLGEKGVIVIALFGITYFVGVFFQLLQDIM